MSGRLTQQKETVFTCLLSLSHSPCKREEIPTNPSLIRCSKTITSNPKQGKLNEEKQYENTNQDCIFLIPMKQLGLIPI